jgi:hypothetical protein
MQALCHCTYAAIFHVFSNMKSRGWHAAHIGFSGLRAILSYGIAPNRVNANGFRWKTSKIFYGVYPSA